MNGKIDLEVPEEEIDPQISENLTQYLKDLKLFRECEKSSPDLKQVQLLLQQGANPNEKFSFLPQKSEGFERASSLEYVITNNLLLSDKDNYPTYRDAKLLHLLLSFGGDIQVLKEQYHHLFSACKIRSDYNGLCLDVLMNCGLDNLEKNCLSRSGGNPFHELLNCMDYHKNENEVKQFLGEQLQKKFQVKHTYARLKEQEQQGILTFLMALHVNKKENKAFNLPKPVREQLVLDQVIKEQEPYFYMLDEAVVKEILSDALEKFEPRINYPFYILMVCGSACLAALGLVICGVILAQLALVIAGTVFGLTALIGGSIAIATIEEEDSCLNLNTWLCCS